MSAKKNKGKKSASFEAFNKSQQIYKLLEKGIIESEALSSSSTDRPEQEDHIANLLGSSEAKPQNPVVRKLGFLKRKVLRQKPKNHGAVKSKKSMKLKAGKKVAKKARKR